MEKGKLVYENVDIAVLAKVVDHDGSEHVASVFEEDSEMRMDVL